MALKRRKEYKEVVKEAGGNITDVSIIISPGKMILRISSPKGPIDKPFTKEEMLKFCKGLNIKEADVEDSKYIFISFDMNKKTIHFKREKKDGTPILLEL